jgi:DNA-directed RNA polymerase specialized sigma24 family protein
MTVQPSTDSVWSQLSADLRRFIRRRVSDEHVADDLLQETSVRIHRHIDSLADADRLEAWVYQIALPQAVVRVRIMAPEAQAHPARLDTAPANDL